MDLGARFKSAGRPVCMEQGTVLLPTVVVVYDINLCTSRSRSTVLMLYFCSVEQPQ
jgi:hypothetical protein